MLITDGTLFVERSFVCSADLSHKVAQARRIDSNDREQFIDKHLNSPTKSDVGVLPDALSFGLNELDI